MAKSVPRGMASKKLSDLIKYILRTVFWSDSVEITFLINAISGSLLDLRISSNLA